MNEAAPAILQARGWEIVTAARDALRGGMAPEDVVLVVDYDGPVSTTSREIARALPMLPTEDAAELFFPVQATYATPPGSTVFWLLLTAEGEAPRLVTLAIEVTYKPAHLDPLTAN